MPHQDPEPYRKMLESLRDELRLSLSKAGLDLQAFSEIPKDLGEQSETCRSTELMLDQVARARQSLRKIEAALTRIHEGTYGECLSCGDEIEGKRLAAMPFAPYCRDCQGRMERRSAGRRVA